MVYFCSDVDILLDVHSGDVVHDDQVAADVLILIVDAIIVSDVVVVLTLYDVIADPDALRISLFDGILSLYVICIYADDGFAIAMSSLAVVDAEIAFVVASLVGVASLLWTPPLDMYSLCLMLISLCCGADVVLSLSDVVVAVCCHCCCYFCCFLLVVVVEDEDDVCEQVFAHTINK